MKYNNIFKSMIIGAAVVALAGCSENSWNEDYLDGFEVPPVSSNVETLDYTLTADDYKNVAANPANVALAKSKGLSKQLSAVGTNGYFTDEIPAKDYLPAYMDSILFPYFALNDGSAINLTYKQSQAVPELITQVDAAEMATVSDDEYKEVWGSTSAYAKAFTPERPASSYLPRLLSQRFPEAVSGDYVLISYNEAEVEPDFENGVITPIKDVKIGETYNVQGFVTAICAQGYILSDDSGSLLVYVGRDFVADNYKIGQMIALNGTGSKYNGGLQMSIISENVVGSEIYDYPAPIELDGAAMNTYRDEFVAANKEGKGKMGIYVKFTANVISTGNYTNFVVEGAETKCSAYQPTEATKALFTKGEDAVITGYMMSVNLDRNTGEPTYLNFIITSVNGTATAPMAEDNPYVPAPTPVESVPANSLYTYNGSAWSLASNVVTLTNDDYIAMGQKYGNLSGTLPETLLPVFLKNKFPYALADDVKYVAYKYYGSDKSTTVRCKELTYNGSEWVMNTNVDVVTEQYVKTKGSWMFNPNVTISIPNVRQSEPGLTFYQTTVDWAKANEGEGYIDRGNSEFFSGCSAYYCNVNHDISQVEKYASSMWPDMTQSVVIPKMRENFLYVTMPATLKALYPEANLIDGYTQPIVYEIDYVTYYGSSAYDGQSGNVNDTVRYEVTGKADFKLIYSTWLGGEVKGE